MTEQEKTATGSRERDKKGVDQVERVSRDEKNDTQTTQAIGSRVSTQRERSTSERFGRTSEMKRVMSMYQSRKMRLSTRFESRSDRDGDELKHLRISSRKISKSVSDFQI